MGWSIGFDKNWNRDIGYGVPATCDHPGCGKAIDRGLGYVCGGDVYGGEHGCGLFFCGDHKWFAEEAVVCARCKEGEDPFDATPDTADWLAHKLSDESWAKWRAGNAEWVARMQAALVAASQPGTEPKAECAKQPSHEERERVAKAVGLTVEIRDGLRSNAVSTGKKLGADGDSIAAMMNARADALDVLLASLSSSNRGQDQ